MPPLRIFVADHDEVIRQIMTAVLAQNGWQVCGEASAGSEAVAKISNLKPDLVFLDINLSNPSGFDTARQIVQQDPAQPIVMLGTSDDEPTARKAFEAGALGYVLKAHATRDLATSVRALTNGRTFFSPRIAENILHSYFQIGAKSDTPPTIRTERDRIAVKLLAREAASAMGSQPRSRGAMPRSIKYLLGAVIIAAACAIIWTNFHDSIEENVPYVHKLLIQSGLKSEPQTVYEGNPDTKVWLDLHTALYYCPGASLYGKTTKGKFSRQQDALEDHFEPAERKACK